MIRKMARDAVIFVPTAQIYSLVRKVHMEVKSVKNA
jgi:hypothetical protein